jgi:uncharacterized protein (TIGR03437 family)
VLRRSAASWQIYAAVTGSAMAMATSASAATAASGIRDVTAEPAGGVLAATQHFASSRYSPLTNAIRLAVARQSGKITLGAAANQAAVTQPPSITPGGIVPLDGTTGIIQPGEWVTIYGNNLASEAATWNGDFPLSLGGTRVEINGKPAYLMYVSPGQINLQAPDDAARGQVSVVVTTAAGSATSTVTLSEFAPAFNLVGLPSGTFLPAGGLGYVSGIIIRSDHSGAYGGGSYDLLGPTGNAFGYATVAAQPGDIVEIYGVGFGPTTPTVPAGQAFTGAAAINVTNDFALYINNVLVKPSFVGLSSAGLYQINLTIPSGLGEGDLSLMATCGGLETQRGVLFSTARSGAVGTGTFGPIGTVIPPVGTFFPPPSFGAPGTFGPGPGSFGPGTGGTGGGGSSGRAGHAKIKKHYRPKLKYPPQ